MENIELEKVNLILKTQDATEANALLNSISWELDYNQILSVMRKKYKTNKFNIVLKNITYQTTTDVGPLKVKVSGENFINEPKYIGFYRTDDPTQQNFILNGSFESPQYPNNTYDSAGNTRPVDNWNFVRTGASALQIITGTGSAWAGSGGIPQSGTQLIVCQQGGAPVGNFSISQDGVFLEKGIYTISLYVRARGAPNTNTDYMDVEISLNNIEALKYSLPPTPSTWIYVENTFNIEDDGDYTLLIYVVPRAINNSMFIDNIRINRADYQVNYIPNNPITFYYNDYSPKFKLNVELEEGFSDVLNTTGLPHQTFNFEIYPLIN